TPRQRNASDRETGKRTVVPTNFSSSNARTTSSDTPKENASKPASEASIVLRKVFMRPYKRSKQDAQSSRIRSPAIPSNPPKVSSLDRSREANSRKIMKPDPA